MTFDVARPVIVRPLDRDDLVFAAALHREALSHGFFAALGKGFLHTYYGTFLDAPHAVALLAEVDGRPPGFSSEPPTTVRTGPGWSVATAGASRSEVPSRC